MTRVSVVGGSGFVGSAVVTALRERGADVMSLRAPRITTLDADARDRLVTQLQDELPDVDVLVNAAGVPDATGDSADLWGANAVLPGVLAQAARRRGIRFVHISSAAVQGDVAQLDDSVRTHPFSPYSESKAAGEAAVREQVEAASSTGFDAIIYRPPGVHHPSRPVTQKLARLARGRAASVAGRGDAPTAQALLENVADAVAFLALTQERPPLIVHHPGEGLTTSSLLTALGGRPPRHVPAPLARAVVTALQQAGRVKPGFAGVARRVEMLWFGQAQAPSWLETAGWRPVMDVRAWATIGRELRTKENNS